MPSRLHERESSKSLGYARSICKWCCDLGAMRLHRTLDSAFKLENHRKCFEHMRRSSLLVPFTSIKLKWCFFRWNTWYIYRDDVWLRNLYPRIGALRRNRCSTHKIYLSNISYSVHGLSHNMFQPRRGLREDTSLSTTVKLPMVQLSHCTSPFHHYLMCFE